MLCWKTVRPDGGCRAVNVVARALVGEMLRWCCVQCWAISNDDPKRCYFNTALDVLSLD